MFGSLAPWRKHSLVPGAGRLLPMERFSDDMEALWDRFLNHDGERFEAFSNFVPTTDVAETESCFEVTVDLPGLKPEEVDVEMKDGALWISGRREEEKEETGKTYHCVERRHGEFRRVLPLPSTIDESKIEAKVENGVLKVSIPKSEEAKAKHIEVKC